MSAQALTDDDLVRELLRRVGADVAREGLSETPQRFIKALRFYTSGYQQDPAAVLKCFKDGAEGYDEMVIQTNISCWSTCEHHIAPFWGVLHIGYIPNERVVGLSKLSRLADIYCRRLQVQERMTNQIADAMVTHLNPIGVGVVAECRHTCMESRGIQKAGTVTVTSALRGALADEASARAEFMSFVRSNHRSLV